MTGPSQSGILARMIKLTNVVKAFGLRPVLRGLNLEIPAGRFVTLFGPNGAGKTTTLRLVAALSRPTAGEISVGGASTSRNPDAVRGLLGVVSHQTLLYGDLSAAENLHFYGRMYGLEAAEREKRIDVVLEAVGLSARRRDLARTFSRGMQQRLAIARAILHDPPVLLLDEPYTGLDVDAAATLDEVLREVATRGRTVLMTTHDLARGLSMAHYAAILAGGKLAFYAPTGGWNPVAFAEKYAELTGMASVR